MTFDTLLTAHAPRVFRAALGWLGDEQEARECAQEALLKAHRARRRYDTARPFYPWLHRIVRNTVFDALARRKHRAVPGLQEAWVPSDAPSVLDTLAQRESAEAVRRGLDRLGEDHREILILRHFQDLSYAEMAQLLQIPEGTVMSRLYRAPPCPGARPGGAPMTEDRLEALMVKVVDDLATAAERRELMDHLSERPDLQVELAAHLALKSTTDGWIERVQIDVALDRFDAQPLRRLEQGVGLSLILGGGGGADRLRAGRDPDGPRHPGVHQDRHRRDRGGDRGAAAVGGSVAPRHRQQGPLLGGDPLTDPAVPALAASADLAHRPEGLMLLTTDAVPPGFALIEVVGLVRGNTIRARHLGNDIVAALKGLVGGEISEYTKMMAESREQALDRMRAEAVARGANAVIGVRLTTSMIMQGSAEILAYGTAVRLARAEG